MAQALLERLQGGSGAVSRGPGSSPLTFGNEQPDLAEQFTPKRLPPGGLDALRQSGLIGVSATAPEVTPLIEAGGQAAFGDEGARTSFQRRVAPRHRDAIREFFASAPGPQPAPSAPIAPTAPSPPPSPASRGDQR